MADLAVLNKVNFPEQSCILKAADSVLFFARNALGYEDITYKKIENAKPGENQFQLIQSGKVKNCFARVLCAIVAIALFIPAVIALAIKACLKSKQDAAVEKINAQGVTKLLPDHSSSGSTSGFNSSTSSSSTSSNSSSVSGAGTEPSRVRPSIKATEAHLKMARTAITEFANDLCARISSEKGNQSYSVSPVSIIAALGMCLHAIRADKKETFIEKIGLKGLTEQQVHGAIALTLFDMEIPKNFKDGTINIAQGMAYKDKNDVADSFIELVKKIYGADVIVSQNLMDEVNKWVSAKTNAKIPTLLSDNLADLVLLNAVYLNLQWKDKFKKRDSWPVQNFTGIDGKTAPVSMMTQKGDFLMYRGPECSMLEKPYLSPDGRKLSQVIFLPDDPKMLPKLEEELTAEQIKNCRTNAKLEYDVTLRMPKTKAVSEFHMLELLTAMGLPLDTLDPEIVRGRITDVIHKTYVSTNEEGTEAAAATGILTEKCCISEPKYFNIKHAYTYLIMDGDAVLFRGRVSDSNPLVVDK